MMRNDADVLVVGAGPAGTAAAVPRASRRARAPRRSRRFPRDKLCGDTLNPGALSILDRLGVARRCAHVRAADYGHDRDGTRR